MVFADFVMDLVLVGLSTILFDDEHNRCLDCAYPLEGTCNFISHSKDARDVLKIFLK